MPTFFLLCTSPTLIHSTRAAASSRETAPCAFACPTNAKTPRIGKTSRLPQAWAILNECCDTQRMLWSGMPRGSERTAWPQSEPLHLGEAHFVATQFPQSHRACLTAAFVEYRPRLWQTRSFVDTRRFGVCWLCLSRPPGCLHSLPFLLQGHPVYKNPHFCPKGLGVHDAWSTSFGELRVSTRGIRFTCSGAPGVLPTTNPFFGSRKTANLVPFVFEIKAAFSSCEIEIVPHSTASMCAGRWPSCSRPVLAWRRVELNS